MAIKLNLSKTDECLFCKSKWWGNPDIPEGFSFDDSLMFLCQIRCEDLVSLDKENRLPHKGMLYFFCDIPYYLGFYEEFEPPYGRLWDSDYVKVYYVEDVVEEEFRQIVFDDDFLPFIHERKIEFVQTNEDDYCNQAADDITCFFGVKIGEGYLLQVSEGIVSDIAHDTKGHFVVAHVHQPLEYGGSGNNQDCSFKNFEYAVKIYGILANDQVNGIAHKHGQPKREGYSGKREQ